LLAQGLGYRRIGRQLGLNYETLRLALLAKGLRSLRDHKDTRSPYREKRGLPVNPELEDQATIEFDSTSVTFKSRHGKHKNKIGGLTVIGWVTSGQRIAFDMAVYPDKASSQETAMAFFETQLEELRFQCLKGDVGSEFASEWQTWANNQGLTYCLVSSKGGCSKPHIESLWGTWKKEYFPLFDLVKDQAPEKVLFAVKWAIAKYKQAWNQPLTPEEEALTMLPTATPTLERQARTIIVPYPISMSKMAILGDRKP